MATIRDRITSLLNKFRFAPAQTTIEQRPSSRSSSNVAHLRDEMDRRKIVELCREMYKTDTRVKQILFSVARDMTQGDIEISCPDNEKAQTIARDMLTRLNLGNVLDDFVRLTLRDGDSFIEIGVDNALLIQELNRKPTLGMHRDSNALDRFDDPTRAYWFSDNPWTTPRTSKDTLWFADWQIIHARWDHDCENKYGTPMFGCATGDWKRVKDGEFNIAVRRATRSGVRYLHVIETTDEGGLTKYMQDNKDALDDPFAAITDFFATNKASITAIQGDAQLGEIDDVMHHIRTFWIASPLPMSLLGYGQDLNRDVLDEQEEQYRRALEPLTRWVENTMILPLLELQWLLAGILPDEIMYTVTRQTHEPLTAELVSKAAEAALRLKALGLPNQIVWGLLAQFLPGLDLHLLIEGEPVATQESIHRVLTPFVENRAMITRTLDRRTFKGRRELR